MITSTANAQVKELVKLMKKSRARDEAQVFLIEGPRMAGELADDPGWSRKIGRSISLRAMPRGTGRRRKSLRGLHRWKSLQILCSHMYPARRRRRAYLLS